MPNRLRTLLAALAGSGLLLLLAPPATAASDQTYVIGAPTVVHTVTRGDTTITLDLEPVALRGPAFEVLLQGDDGTLVPQVVVAERAYLGTVQGDPAATASAVIRSDGTLAGQVVFDRGATWYFEDGTVTSTRGLTPPAEFRWPSATDARRNVSVAPGQVGTTTYRWDLAFDVDTAWFEDAGSVDAALDTIELTTVSLLATYERDALLRPAIGRVILRGSATHSPYASGQGPLSAVRAEWRTNQTDTSFDDVALLHTSGGGGSAFLGTAGDAQWAFSQNGGAGAQRPIIRHELGHTWGADDNHTNGPEGATINSGNAYDRFDGTELSAMMRYRDAEQAGPAPFTPEAPFAVSLPPYAALDLVDALTGAVPVTIDPVANDHDANGGALTLVSVDGSSAKGGILTVVGSQALFVPPLVSEPGTIDWFHYVVRDPSGRIATGVVITRVDPPLPGLPAVPLPEIPLPELPAVPVPEIPVVPEPELPPAAPPALPEPERALEPRATQATIPAVTVPPAAVVTTPAVRSDVVPVAPATELARTGAGVATGRLLAAAFAAILAGAVYLDLSRWTRSRSVAALEDRCVRRGPTG